MESSIDAGATLTPLPSERRAVPGNGAAHGDPFGQHALRPNKRTLSLRSWLAVLICIFVVTGALAVLYVSSTANADAVHSSEASANLSARVAAEEITTVLGQTQQAVAEVAADPRIAGLFSDPANCQLDSVVGGVFATGHIDILRSDGAIVCSSEKEPVAVDARGYAGAPWWTHALSAPIAEGPVTDPLTGKEALVVSAPVPNLGIVVVIVDLEGVGTGLASLFSGPDHLEFLVTTPDGKTSLSRSIDPAAWAGTSLRGTSFFAGEATPSHGDVNGVARLYGESTVPSLGWRVYAGQDAASALASAGQLRDREILIVLIGLALTFSATLVVYRRITKPILALSGNVAEAAAERVPAPVDDGGPKEVALLANSVNTLVAAVRRELAERRRAQAQIQASERAYRALFEANPIPMWVHDRNTMEFLQVNGAAVACYGYSHDELLSMAVTDLQPRSGTVPVFEAFTGDGISESSGPWRQVKKDGTTVDIEITSYPVFFLGRDARFVMAAPLATGPPVIEHQFPQSRHVERVEHPAGSSLRTSAT